MSGLLSVDKANFFIGPLQVLRDVSLSISKNESIMLIGRNGAGKTSTLKTIMGLYMLTSGRIVFDGADITKVPAHIRASKLGIAYSPEDSKVFPDLTVEENIKMGLWLTGNKKNDEKDIMETIYNVFPEIKPLMKRKGIYCSGGEKKMVSVARALALRPKLMLLDEPMEGLAPVVVQRFKKALNEIENMGISLLITESNVNTALSMNRRTLVIERGEIIYEGDPSEIPKREEIYRVVRGV
jgi:branched-chain amino acid transport system ATP-binding protein